MKTEILYAIRVRSTDGHKLEVYDSEGDFSKTLPAGEWFTDEVLDQGSNVDVAKMMCKDLEEFYLRRTNQKVEVKVFEQHVTYKEVS